MLCVSTVTYTVSVMTSLCNPSNQLKRGLRQGDPLSLYLFIFCADGLSNLISQAVDRGDVHECRICRGAPIVSHLLFVDDSFLFFRVNPGEARSMQSIMSQYERESGQAINCKKSGIMFNRNINQGIQDQIATILGVTNPLNTGRYLGLSSLVGRSKRQIFGFLHDRLRKRFQGWQGKLLSQAGKEVLIKALHIV